MPWFWLPQTVTTQRSEDPSNFNSKEYLNFRAEQGPSLVASQVELLTPPEGSKPGDKITVEGFPGEPDAQLNAKKKIWETVQPDLRTNPELIACFKGVPLTTAGGHCTVASLGDASIG